MNHNHGIDVLGYVTPGTKYGVWMTEAQAEMQTVLREGTTLNADINSYKSSDTGFASFKTAWNSFWEEFKKFYAEKSKDKYFGASEIYDRSVEYGNKLNDWRAQFVRFPAARVAEPAVVREQPRPPALPETSFPWKTVGVGLAVVGGLGGAFYLFKKFNPASRALSLAGLLKRPAATQG